MASIMSSSAFVRYMSSSAFVRPPSSTRTKRGRPDKSDESGIPSTPVKRCRDDEKEEEWSEDAPPSLTWAQHNAIQCRGITPGELILVQMNQQYSNSPASNTGGYVGTFVLSTDKSIVICINGIDTTFCLSCVSIKKITGRARV